MISLGAVVIAEPFDQTFYAEMAPLAYAMHDPEAAAVGGFTLEKQLAFREPAFVMRDFDTWLSGLQEDGSRLQFVSDNAGFDWAYLNHYLHRFVDGNRFGFSPFSLTSAYKGFKRDVRANFRKDGLRKTKHTHSALDDAQGNAEAFLAMVEQGFRL